MFAINRFRHGIFTRRWRRYARGYIFPPVPIAFIVPDRLDEPGGDIWRERYGFNVRI
jgi:hypothetical protein